MKRGTFRAVLDSDGSYLQRKDNPQVYVPLYMRRNSFYFKAKLQNGKYTVGQQIRSIEPAGWAAPVTDEQMWEYPEMQEEEAATVTQDTPPPPTPLHHVFIVCVCVHVGACECMGPHAHIHTQ